MFGGDLEINVVEVNIFDLSIHSDAGREKENNPSDTDDFISIVIALDRAERSHIMAEKNIFTGNVDRAIRLGKMFPKTCTGEPPTKVGEGEGAFFFTVKVGVVIDTRFPTKAGNTTTTVVIVPLDGAKDFPIEGGKIKMDGVPPFIYQGRGDSQVFTAYADNGDVVKRTGRRKSAASEIEELKKQLSEIAAMLSKK